MHIDRDIANLNAPAEWKRKLQLKRNAKTSQLAATIAKSGLTVEQFRLAARVVEQIQRMEAQ